ncbi:DUF2190 family protein [Candidatus Bathyarchaeota archaeon A05DMB-2]|jgi:hypothetical protein|nr:DUF2190 family protein [Candidatus Bathyarchaeota archaeon A05DMB-2]
MADVSGKTWMAIGETDDPNAIIETFEAAAAVTKGDPVYLSADDKVSPSPGGDDAIGIATKTVSSGQPCPVLTRGRVKVKAGGAITRGKAVCSAANGKVIQLVDQPVDEGGTATYTIFYNRKLGTALETTTTDGDLLFIHVNK